MKDGIELFDPERIRAALGEGDDCPGSDDDQRSDLRYSTEEDQWRRTLRGIVGDPRGHWRPMLMGSGDTWADLASLEAAMPHLSQVTDLIQRANDASVRSQTRIRFAPMLLLGPPGIGKTYYARRVAKALGTGCTEIAMNMSNDRGRLSGYSMSWRGARMGDVAKGALASNTSSPLFFVDEIDKSDERERAHDVLLSLLEPENAMGFADEYLTSIATLRLDHALWIATANDVGRIPAPVLDRMLVIDVPAPVGDQLRAVIRSIYASIATAYGHRFAKALKPEMLQELEEISPRVMKRLLDLAIRHALSERRWALSPSDIKAASDLVNAGPQRHRVGFTS